MSCRNSLDLRRRSATRPKPPSMAYAALLLSILAGCERTADSGQSRKSPFATGNVSVAPQIEGRAPAPTPVPAPRPGLQATPARE
jgi:hypothetical protein